MERIIDILIPTYNRCECLEKNIKGLIEQIAESDLQKQISILISDNSSTDDTQSVAKDLIQNNPTIHIAYYRQPTNIGLEPNVVDLMGRASSPYVMWIGDDDYIAPGYLHFCLAQIIENKIGCIIPGLSNLYEDGTIVESRVETFDHRPFAKGFDSMHDISHLAHQMSGILLKKENLLKSYLAKPAYRNPYLFIFWTADCLFRHGGIYAPKYKSLITTFNAKDWGYNKVGLLDVLFNSYYYFIDELSNNQIKKILLRFSTMHAYRYNIHWSKPFALIAKYNILTRTLPQIKGLKSALAKQLSKDYLLSFKPKNREYPKLCVWAILSQVFND